MQDVFYEETALHQNEKSNNTKYYIFKSLHVFFIVGLVVYVALILAFYDFGRISEGSLVLNIIFLILPVVLCVLSTIIFYKAKNNYCVDYDYTFVTGSVRVAKVIKNFKRKHLYSFNTTAIERLGKFGSDTFNNYAKMPDIKFVYLTSNKMPTEGKDFYYLAVNGIDKTKVILIFECTETLMVNILKFSNKMIIEKDFK